MCSGRVIITMSVIIIIIIRLFPGIWQETEAQFEENPIKGLFIKVIGKEGGKAWHTVRYLRASNGCIGYPEGSPSPEGIHRGKTVWKGTNRNCDFPQGRSWGISTQPLSPLPPISCWFISSANTTEGQRMKIPFRVSLHSSASLNSDQDKEG